MCFSLHTRLEVASHILVQYLKQKRAQLAALGEWTHINCLQAGAVDRVEDDMLTHLIYSPEEDTKASSTKAPQSLSEKLFDAADKIMSEERSSARDNVPGGSISFLFERSSKSLTDDGHDD